MRMIYCCSGKERIMSRFSEQLEYYILKSGYTEVQLAQVSGFNRSYIALMKNGQRVSPDIDKMKRLFEALHLTLYEYEELWDAYLSARLGDDVYRKNKEVIRFLESFQNLSEISVDCSYEHVIPEIKIVRRRMDVEYIMQAVMEHEAEKQEGSIKIIMQAEDSVLFTILPHICKKNKNLKVEQIICLENQIGNEKNALYNIHQLQYLMRTVIYSFHSNLDIFYYYDNVQAHFNEMSLFPYVIITTEYVICIHSSMEYGMLFKEKEIQENFIQLFERHKKKCRSLFKRIEGEYDWVYHYANPGAECNVCYTIAQQPCLGFLNIDSLIRKCIPDRWVRIRHALQVKIRENNKCLINGSLKPVSYCTQEGIRRFCREGVIDQLPVEIYNRLGKEDRLAVLIELKEMILQNKYELYVLKEQAAIPKEINLTLMDMFDVTLTYMSEKKEMRFLLEEASLTGIMWDFFENYKKTPLVMAGEEVVAYLDMQIEEVK